MYATWSENNWNNNSKRQLVAFVVSILLLVLILFIPIQLQQQVVEPIKSLKIEFSEVSIESKIKTQVEPKKMNKTVEKSSQKSINKSVKKPQIITQSTPEKTVKPQKAIELTKPLPKSGVILNTLNQRKDFRTIDKDFQATTQSDNDFKFKIIDKSEIYQMQKYVNEEVDKPQIQMRYRFDSNLVSTIKVVQGLLGGIYDNTEKKYIDCDLEVQDIPDWQCQ